MTRWLGIVAVVASACATYDSPCALGPDETVLVPTGIATGLRRSATGVVVTSESATTTTSPQRTVTITALDVAGVVGTTQTFSVGSTALDVPTDVEWTGAGLAIARALEKPSPDFGSIARSLELEIRGPAGPLLAPRTLAFADCTDCPPRLPILRFLDGHLVLLYAGGSTTSTLFAILALDGTILASGPLVGLTPTALGRFKLDPHADGLVLETPGMLELVDGSLVAFATLPAPAGSALDFDRARGVAQLAWIESEASITSSLLTQQLGFDGRITQPITRISEAIAINSVAASDSLAVFGFIDDGHYVATAAAGTKLGGDLVTPSGLAELAVPMPDGFAYFTNAGTSVHRRELTCAP